MTIKEIEHILLNIETDAKIIRFNIQDNQLKCALTRAMILEEESKKLFSFLFNLTNS